EEELEAVGGGVKETGEANLLAEDLHDSAVRTDAILNPSAAAAIEPREDGAGVHDEADHHGDLDDGPNQLGGSGHQTAWVSVVGRTRAGLWSEPSLPRISLSERQVGSRPSARASVSACAH